MDMRKKDEHGEWRYMIDAHGYVMARRPGCAPFVFTVKKWNEMPSPAEYDETKSAYDAALSPSGEK